MSDMDHMGKRWRLGQVDSEGFLPVYAGSWHVLRMSINLPNDPTGERTARAIVDAHNAGLDAPLAAPSPITPDPVAARRAERLDVASRIAAGMCASAGYPYSCSDSPRVILFADALIAAVDAEGVAK